MGRIGSAFAVQSNAFGKRCAQNGLWDQENLIFCAFGLFQAWFGPDRPENGDVFSLRTRGHQDPGTEKNRSAFKEHVRNKSAQK